MTGAPLRVLVVDDSPTSRTLLGEILQADPRIEVVAEASDGSEAVRLVEAVQPSLVLMDVRMPGMDGFQATERIMAQRPTPVIIVTAGHTRADVEVSLRALRAGALTVLPKPSGPGAPGSAAEAAHLRSLVHALADVRVVRRRATAAAAPRGLPPASRPRTCRSIKAVGVAVSTGGPVALQRFLCSLPGGFPAPVLVVQHIADGFVAGLAEWLTAGTDLDVVVAVDGATMRPGVAYLAPDGRHLEVRSRGTVALSHAPPVGGFRPSATVLLRSLASAHGAEAAAVVLTGMGSDGLEGARAVRMAGGLVLAQDQQTSTVYGMPKAVADAGLAHAVAPVEQLAHELARSCR